MLQRLLAAFMYQHQLTSPLHHQYVEVAADPGKMRSGLIVKSNLLNLFKLPRLVKLPRLFKLFSRRVLCLPHKIILLLLALSLKIKEAQLR
jgi:hypothetical protein